MGRTRKKAHTRPFMPGRRHDGAAFVLSFHAIEQFRARICPQFSLGRARVEAKVLVLTAKKSDEVTGQGDEIWEAQNGAPVRFVVRNENGRRTCVTCLPALAPGEKPDEEPIDG